MELTKEVVIGVIQQIQSGFDIDKSTPLIDRFLACCASVADKADIREAIRQKAQQMRQECQRIRQAAILPRV
jgi:hypothetical protein